MAKSKNGGTRSFIKGRIGSDVYSVGKDGKGNRQQVVRSLAEQVSNPRTSAQMFGRMIMSSVMQNVSQFAFIIDHSFDGQPKGQPSISEFIRTNYALVKADAEAHPSSGNEFGLNKFQEKFGKVGKYVISKGSAVAPANMTLADGSGNSFSIVKPETFTFGNFKQNWGLSDGEYITLINWKEKASYNTDGAVELCYCRVSLSKTMTDETVLTSENIKQAFEFEGNQEPIVSIVTDAVELRIADDDSVFFGTDTCIITRKVNGSFVHNTAVMPKASGLKWTASVALPTYPTGSNQYLNGGDL